MGSIRMFKPHWKIINQVQGIYSCFFGNWHVPELFVQVQFSMQVIGAEVGKAVEKGDLYGDQEIRIQKVATPQAERMTRAATVKKTRRSREFCAIPSKKKTSARMLRMVR